MIKKILTTKEHQEFLQQRCVHLNTQLQPEKLDEIVTNLLDTANCHKKGCAGLAANQIGYGYRIFVIKFGDKFIPIVSPEILERSAKRKLSTEGCLSRPGRKSKVMRHRTVKARYFDPVSGRYTTRKFKGFDAIVFQHEYDHCEGILI